MPKLMNINYDTEAKEMSKEEVIEIKKKINNHFKETRKKSKQNKCFYCNKPQNKFCNSHSIPKSILKNIEENGEVLTNNAIIHNPFEKECEGINSAGTFNLICRECDSKEFFEYENFENFNEGITQKILAQIALKIEFKELYRKLNNYNEKKSLKEHTFDIDGPPEKNLKEVKLDQKVSLESIKKAKYINEHPKDKGYYLIYYRELDYVVPLAFQDSIPLVCGFDDVIINDLFYFKDSYKISPLYICIFPLEGKSIILMFINNNDKRYRRFYKEFNKLNEYEKLEVINYIVILYSENIFISPKIKNIIDQDYNLKKNVSKTSDIEMSILDFLIYSEKELKKQERNLLTENYRLDKRLKITNLLSEENKIK